MNHLIEQAKLSDQIICDSAGTSNYHIGEPPDPRMTVAASRRGIQLEGKARQFNLSDFDKFDLILAMDRENYQNILLLDPIGKYKTKVRLICDFVSNSSIKDVPDPYYGGREGFDRVIDLLLDACSGLLEEVKQRIKDHD